MTIDHNQFPSPLLTLVDELLGGETRGTGHVARALMRKDMNCISIGES
jgi:hypothetical protein